MLVLAALSMISCASISAVDGDTIKCDGRNMRLLGNGSPFVDGVDAPEIDEARCDREKALALKARDRLQELLNDRGLRVEDSGEVDRYERPLVRVRLSDGRIAEQMLIDEGLAVVWKPGRTHDWCRGG